MSSNDINDETSYTVSTEKGFKNKSKNNKLRKFTSITSLVQITPDLLEDPSIIPEIIVKVNSTLAKI